MNIPAAHAQVTVPGLGSTFGLGTADLQSTVINVIQWALGLMALISTTMLIAGAIDWMISGDSEVVKTRAKRIMLGSIIGDVIILLAWAIVTFLFGTVTNVTT
ncbi:MAG: hypothetical protein HY341_00880 [Candidatus Kerfeldbacteria bacterium]|nr:hypothetical protein [Candidatus Kerfeldbacteria bacterium]